MLKGIVGAVGRFILPDGLILGAVLAAVLLLPVPATLERYADVVGVSVAAIGLGLGLRFHRHRFLFGLLFLGLADLALNHVTGPAAVPVSTATTLLLPLDLALLALLRSRRSRQALALSVVAGGQILAVAATAWPLTAMATPPPADALTDGVPGGTMVVVVAGAALVVALALVIRWEPKRRGFLWAILAVPPAVDAAAAGDGASSTIILVAAGVLLVIAAIEDVHALAYRDALTGLPARRALDEVLGRLGARYTIAMVDVDRFKAFNDRWGHDAGDHTLRMVAQQLRRIDGGGQAFRYGGEEFAVVFPGLTLEQATPHLEAVRRAVADHPFTVRQDSAPLFRSRRRSDGSETVTVSVGAAEQDGRAGAPRDVLKAADRALYRAKQNGRNRLETAAED